MVPPARLPWLGSILYTRGSVDEDMTLTIYYTGYIIHGWQLTVANSLYEKRLQETKTNLQSKMMSPTTMIPRRRIS